ncbi:MAG: SurA N-terminal domain-containing protein [Deltaproteobacteria bacterium]|nr:SurA N-terminal domain-containing protein [Deltaproteobacteria bacterium]
MASLECPNCGSALVNEAAVCRECGKEVNVVETASAPPAKNSRSKNIPAILAVFLAAAGGVVLLIFTDLLPNPIKGTSTAAIVNGEKISLAEVDRKFEVYQKMSGKSGQKDSSSPAGKVAAAEARMRILQTMIQEKIHVTEAIKEGIGVTPQEIADRIGVVKKNLNYSDKDFDTFLQKHDMALAHFEKRIEKDLLIEKLIAKGTKEKGLSEDAWLAELDKRAKVEILVR